MLDSDKVWRMSLCVVGFGLLFAVASSRSLYPYLAHAGKQPTLDIVDQVGGVSLAVAIGGQHAFLGVGSRLLALDISTTAKPEAVGWSSVLPGLIQDVELAGSLAYVVASRREAHIDIASTSSLQIIDVSDVTNIEVVSSVELPGGVTDLCASGRFLYLASGFYGLRVVDVQDPHTPRLIGEFRGEGEVRDVAVKGDYAFVANRYNGLEVFDVTLPSSPMLVGELGVSGFTKNIAVAGNAAYIIGENRESGKGEIYVVDISDPQQPRHVTSLVPGFRMDAAHASDGRLYIVGRDTLLILDIAVPLEPRSVGGGRWPGLANAVAVAGEIVVATADIGVRGEGVNSAGLRVIDVREPGVPRALGSFSTFRWAGPLSMTSSQIVVAAKVSDPALDELHVLDGTSILRQENAVASPVLGRIWDIQKADGFAFLATWDVDVPFAGGGLRIVDVRDPTNLALVGKLEIDGAARALSVDDGRAYLVGEGGLEIVDISSRENPRSIGRLRISPDLRSVDIERRSNYVFLVVVDMGDPSAFGSLLVVDVSSPASAAVVHKESLSIRPAKTTLSDTTLYIVGDQGLQALDITDPLQPHLVGRLDFDSGIYDLAIDNGIGYAVVGGESAAVRDLAVLDLEQLPNFAILEIVPMPAAPVSVFASEGRVLVGDGDGGLLVLRRDVASASSSTPSSTNDPSPTPTRASATATHPTSTEVPENFPFHVHLPSLGKFR